MKQRFSDSRLWGSMSFAHLPTPYSGKWVRLTQPMRLVTYRGNYDAEWHQLLDMSMNIPEAILKGGEYTLLPNLRATGRNGVLRYRSQGI